jgi:uncharacterized protein YrrD
VAEPVSWFVIERGWRVVGRDGEEVGRVDEVVGDTESDIFNGLSVSKGLLQRRRYVPAERVSEIQEGRVLLDLDKAGFDSLGEHEEPPPSARITPDTTDL